MPSISIVMASYNSDAWIENTLRSILAQSYRDFELIIIEDGSSDQTSAIIKQFSDSRIQLIEQPNTGLTKALMRGCALARGKYIARHDAGDFSFENRLADQMRVLEENHQTVLVSCSTKFVTPLNEQVYIIDHSKNSTSNTLEQRSTHQLIGPPHHGSVMFRTADYKKVGGYRAQFKVAQDIDLWSRLLEFGNHISLATVAYQAILEPDSISMCKRDQQLQMQKFIIECIKERKAKGNDDRVLNDIENYYDKELNKPRTHHDSKAAYNYFLGSNLLKTKPSASLKYLRESLRHNYLQPKAYLKLIYAGFLTMLRSRRY